MGLAVSQRKGLVDAAYAAYAALPVYRQCRILGFARSSYYYRPCGESKLNLGLMNLVDRIYTKHPFMGILQITDQVKRRGYQVNHKRIARLMGIMGIAAIAPGPHTSVSRKEHIKYPYLLKGLTIDRPNQVWAADITYVPMAVGFLYLVAIMDWYSRYVLSWTLSNSMETSFCITALTRAVRGKKPEIVNTDQGSQFTSEQWTGVLSSRQIKISMDSRGRFLDNIFVERLWRTVKYEDIYLKCYSDGHTAEKGLREYFRFYNIERPHQSLGHRTPHEVYHGH